jgi:dimethylargininase
MPLALVREVPNSFSGAVTRRRARPPLDLALARNQHLAYRSCLEQGGFQVVVLSADQAHPDCHFIEDTAVVVGGAALLTRPGHLSRRGEPVPVGEALRRWLPVTVMEEPATLDGGDVLRVGRRLFVGCGERSNAAGLQALARFATPLGFEVVPIEVKGVLHLKSAVTAVDEHTVLVGRGASGLAALSGIDLVDLEDPDPEAANVVRLPDGRILVAESHPATAAVLSRLGFTSLLCDVSEFARADGGLTCLSVRIRDQLGSGQP